MSDDSPNLWARHTEAHTKEAVPGEVVGSIPIWLNGRLIRNGPGGKCIGESTFNHLFDGMAVLHMVNIEDGKASYMSRYLESEAYTKNHRANRIMVTEFGTLGVPDPCLSLFDKFSAMFLPTLNRKMTDNCSVNVWQVKDEILAMTETDSVRVLDPTTLDTKPEKIQYSKHVAVQRATAHPHEGEDGTVYNLAFSLSEKKPCYAIVSLPEGKISEAKIESELPCRWKFNPGYAHSFGMTENYYIITESPLSFDLLQMIQPPITGMTAFKSLKFYKNQNTKFRVMSRKTGKEVMTNFIAPDFFNFHFMNCFEANGCLIIDVCAIDDNIIALLDMENLRRKVDDPKRQCTNVEPRRYVLPLENLESAPAGDELLKNVPESKISRDDFLASASAVKQDNGDILVKPVVIADITMELPRINYKYNTKPYKYAYGIRVEDYKKSFLDFDGLTKLNMQTGEELVWQDNDFFTSEPVFVETPAATGEDDGVIITILLHKTNPRKLALLVLDATSMTEVARVNFLAAGSVTPTFHGLFMKTSGNVKKSSD